jgi:hypothetical protein
VFEFVHVLELLTPVFGQLIFGISSDSPQNFVVDLKQWRVTYLRFRPAA